MFSQAYNILHTEWSGGWGGQEQRIILECCKMRELGHKVVIACQPGSGILEKAKARGIATEEVVMRGSIDPRAVFGLLKVIKRHRINVVSTHSGKDSWSAGFAAKLAGVDLLVRTRHLSVPISNNPFNIVYKMADGIVTTGESIRSAMISDNGMDPELVRSIATGVSLQRFCPEVVPREGLRRELGVPDGCKIVTMVAVLRGMKRHDLLVEAAKQLRAQFPEVRYLLVGEGPGRELLEERIRNAGLEKEMILTGYRDDVPEVLAISDLVVLTSDRFEGVPQSISQAMAMGRPVVAAPVGSTTELVVDGVTGIVAETGNADSFARAIGTLLRDDLLRESMGKAAQAHVLNGYTDDIMAQKTVEFYRYLLERKGKR